MKRRLGRCVAIGALCTAALLTESSLHAEPTPPEAKADREVAAQALYDSATVLMDAHDYASACAKLEEVTNLVPEGLGARLTLADCYERDGKVASAWTQYAMVAPRAARAGQAARQEKAVAKMAELAPRVAKLTIVIAPAVAAARGLSVSRDGVEVGKAQWGIAVPVDAGDHVVETRAPGKLAMKRVLRVDDGTMQSVSVDALVDAPLEQRGPNAASGADRAAARSRETPLRPWQAPVGFTLGGVGLVSASLGFVFGGLAVGKSSAASLECDRNLACSDRGLELRKEGRAFANASTGLLVVGGALTVTGLVLVVTAPRAKNVHARAGVGVGTFVISGDF